MYLQFQNKIYAHIKEQGFDLFHINLFYFSSYLYFSWDWKVPWNQWVCEWSFLYCKSSFKSRLKILKNRCVFCDESIQVLPSWHCLSINNLTKTVILSLNIRWESSSLQNGYWIQTRSLVRWKFTMHIQSRTSCNCNFIIHFLHSAGVDWRKWQVEDVCTDFYIENLSTERKMGLKC